MEELKNIFKNNFYFLSEEEIDKIVQELNNFCIQNNISNLKVIGNGESSVTFEHNNEIIKLTFIEYDNHKSLKGYVSHSKHILQPDLEQIIELRRFSAKILKTKKLQITNISLNDAIDMYCKLRDDGYLWYDTKSENIGKDPNGNLYLLDYGELIYINDLDSYNRKKELETHQIKKPELNKEYIKRKAGLTMTQEQMERLAKYATDKYFDCKSPEAKEFMTADANAFMADYIRTFELALGEVQKSQNNKFREFGTEDNSKAFR